ncbi:unnamed protein product [Mycena citricolor]|uniref:Expansin-like EG45 domain-containing protein n=1 Tax=Mycena citricolor TaxID=2018698 RepID=A0AAD2H7M1_9AGAR|nr:unnamed protein product [Mycena citricolor]CAK5269249.1 unnamed protein product [Mycena citricolor]
MIGAALLLLSLLAPLQVLAAGGYVQKPSGVATFTVYSGCKTPACGRTGSGYTAAINQLAFGSLPGMGAGDSCGRCFALTATSDPYDAGFKGPFGKSIVVKVTDMCPHTAGGTGFCDQSVSRPLNQFSAPVHFDICSDTGGAAAFFPPPRGALKGTFKEVSCSTWSGSDGAPLWNGGCLSGEKASFWPAVSGCGNVGSAPA